MHKLRSAILVTSILTSTPAFSGQAADDLSKCVVGSSTADDRVALMQWMFSSMSSHPSLKTLSNVSDSQRDQFSKKLLDVFSRLITVSCLDKAKAALQAEGPDGVFGSMRSLGQLAASDILSNPAVEEQSMVSFSKYFDPKMFEALKQ